MKPLEPQQVAPVAQAVSLLVAELGDVPLIGFAGAPFTLASYLVEGGPSRNHERTKAMMLGEPATWHALMTALTDVTIAFLQTQVDAGVDAIQLFDSWAGTLSLADYRSYVLPHSTRVFAALAGAGVPMTHFGVGTAELLGAMSEAVSGATPVVGVDWRTSLTDAAARVQPGIALQGNLDPVVLLAGWPVVGARGARRRRGRPARGRRGRGGPRVQPRPWRAARHRSGRDHRRGGIGALAVSRSRMPLSAAGFRVWSPAYRLRVAAGPDATITLFDPADRLGGVLRTERIGGQPLDVGAEAFIARRPEVPALLAELGLAGRQIGTTGARPLIYSQGRLHPMPQRHPAGHPGASRRRWPGWSTTRRSRGSLAERSPAVVLAARRRPVGGGAGRRPVRRAGGDPLGRPAAGGRLRRVGGHDRPALGRPDVGGGARPRRAQPHRRGARGAAAAAERIGVRCRRRRIRGAGRRARPAGRIRWAQVTVERVDRASRGWELVDDEGEHWHADAVVLAVPAPRLPRLIEGVAPRTAAAAAAHRGRVDGAGGAGAAGRHAAARAVGCAGGQRRTRCTPRRLRCRARKWGRRGNVELVRLSFGRFGDDLARNAGDEDLLAWASQDLATVFGVNVEPVDCHVQRWIDAMPQYGPGHAGSGGRAAGGSAADAGGRGRLPRRHRGARLRGVAATRAAASLVTARVAR